MSRLRGSVRTAGAAALVAVGALLAGAVPATAASDGDRYIMGTDTTFAPFEFTDKDGNLASRSLGDAQLRRRTASEIGFATRA